MGGHGRGEQAGVLEVCPQARGDRVGEHGGVLRDLVRCPGPDDDAGDGRMAEWELDRGGERRHVEPLAGGPHAWTRSSTAAGTAS